MKLARANHAGPRPIYFNERSTSAPSFRFWSRPLFPFFLLFPKVSKMKLADAILDYVPLPQLPTYLTSWQPGTTPLSTTPVVVAVMAGYLTTIFSIQYLLKNKPAYVLNTWFRAHNIVLSTGSALLLVLMLEEILPVVFKHGLRYAICDAQAWTPVSHKTFHSALDYILRGRD